MHASVVYDTNYGNTRTVAQLIAKEWGNSTTVVSVSDLTTHMLEGVDVLVVGSPIIGWQPSERMQAFLDSLTPGSLAGVRAAAFDTRVKFFIHGDAAGKISDALGAAGATIFAHPQGFLVDGATGPLAAGESRRAVAWAAFIGAELRASLARSA